MRQNADGTWTRELRGTWTAPTREDLSDTHIFTGKTSYGPRRVHVWDVTEKPLEMPEPMPGMIVEVQHVLRVPIQFAMRDEDGAGWTVGILSVDGRMDAAPWDDNIVRVWSADGTLLWQRSAEPAEPSPT